MLADREPNSILVPHRPRCSINGDRAVPAQTESWWAIDRHFASGPLRTPDGYRCGRQVFHVRGQYRVLKIHRYPGKGHGRHVQQFEEFNAGRLFGWIDILIAIDDVYIYS